jgi:hypothetical protein
VRRIAFANGSPTARITATPSTGVAPLTVDFDGTASSDPENTALSYAWDLDGDGDYDDSTAAKPSHTYAGAGLVTVRLRVTDAAGLTGTTTQLITVGAPPTLTITSPTSATTWAVGDTIAFSGSAKNSLGATLPASALTWSLALRHCSRTDATVCHTHNIQDFAGVASGSFVAPDHEYPSYLQLSLTAVDGAGLNTTQTVRLDPRTADLTLNTSPAGLQLSLGSDTLAAPFTRTVIAKSVNSISAPTPQGANVFASWSDGLGATHAITAPASGTATYTANFTTTSDVLMGGAEVVGANTSMATPGSGEVYRISATRSGNASALRLYVDSASRASKLVLGLYADAGGEPGALLGTGTLAAPTPGAWNTVALSASLTAGSNYWFALLNPADSTGNLLWRDRAGGGGGLERTSLSAALAALPASWATGGRYTDGPVSGGVWGGGAPLPPALAVSPASVSLGATTGGAPVTSTLGINNSGSGALTYSLTDDAAWLTAAPVSGSAPATVTLTANPSGLAAGTYTATITVTPSTGAAKTVPVTLTVAAPSTGLVGAWGFNETSGTTVADASGRGNPGTVSGAARTTAGRFGGALTFDGINDWVTVADSASLDLTTGMTLEGWAYPTGGSDWRTLAIKEGSGELAWALYPFGDGGLPSGHAATGSELWARGTAAPALNTWTHFAVTYDGSAIRLYVNGTQVGTRAQTGSLKTTAGALRFGGNAIWGEFFTGRLDELRLYDRALSAAQITADMGTAVS